MQWQTNTASADRGSSVTFLALSPTTTRPVYVVNDSDSRTLPNPLPPDGFVTFKLAQPILMGQGGLIGLWAPNGSGAVCTFVGGATRLAAQAGILDKPFPGPFFSGEKVTLVTNGPAGSRVIVAVLLVQYQDVAVSALRLRVKPTVGRRLGSGSWSRTTRRPFLSLSPTASARSEDRISHRPTSRLQNPGPRRHVHDQGPAAWSARARPARGTARGSPPLLGHCVSDHPCRRQRS